MSSQESSSFRRMAKSIALRAQDALHREPRTFCLITGPPRSGTTALVLWLMDQDGVVGMNESRVLVAAHRMVSAVRGFRSLHQERDQLLRLTRDWALSAYGAFDLYFGSRTLVDKEPLEPIAFPDQDYAVFLENVRDLFPGIRLLFLFRDPVPTLWSMTQREWGESLRGSEPVSFSLDEHIENWCANVDLALQHADDPRSYLCSYETLVADPLSESERIFRFLGLEKGQPFAPRPTKDVGFGPEDLERIAMATSTRSEALLRLRGKPR